MNTTEVFALTENAIAKLLQGRSSSGSADAGRGRRNAERWPFPGVVELWIPDETGVPQHTLATSINLSTHGVGIRCDEPLDPGLEVDIAVHEPERSFHGRAEVRHCTQVESDHLIGLQFIFSNG